MAGCVAFARQPLLALSKRGLRSAFAVSRPARRTVHASAVVLKKKAAKVDIEDLFSDAPEEDLIGAASETSAEGSTGSPQNVSAPRKRLEPADRHKRFEDLYKSILPHLNANVKERRNLEPIKYSVWTHLVDLAQNEEELRQVINLAPKWKDVHRHTRDKGGLEEQWGELVVRQAESLSCPHVALEMFSNHAKYQVPLSLPAARHLLHSLHQTNSLQDVMTAVALYGVYNLRPVSDDLVSLGLVCRALSNRIHPPRKPPAPKSKAADPSNTDKAASEVAVEGSGKPDGNLKATKQVFEALIQSLQRLLSSTNPSLYTVSSHARTRNLTPEFAVRQKRAAKGQAAWEKEKTWLKWCLARIERNLRAAEGEEKVDWLTQWRQAAGHVKSQSTTAASTA
ncbi:hypothetical protein GYMLUDRAFT_246256 [Collybiopsis luxurians FD-317 M1]|uniref:Unplaced genomic scaffold GYMLUscaffold_38, whole genome shotgun sequence n=1 Tax=Collybiopsis luxurians FD-317 M1 TaxID=944289 RepID=A0A0D0B4J5_9AGAR|nr:hypothetical protein GYMLUDRAFT_246256 [Collybiopsis luxurians FD-317 M1]